MRDGTILRLSAPAGHCVLSFRRPRYDVVIYKSKVAEHRFTGVKAPGPVSIRVGHRVVGGGAEYLKTELCGAIHLPKNPLMWSSVSLTWIVHQHATLLYCIAEV